MPKQLILSLDYETGSVLDLPDVGVRNYAAHPTTEVQMCAYSFNWGPVKQWVPAEFEPMPDDLRAALSNPDCIKFAWNAAFEITITRDVLGIQTHESEWRDSMYMACSRGFPAGLGNAAPAIGIPEDLQKSAGKILINWFASPRAGTRTRRAGMVHGWQKPELWEEYKAYNIQDVRAESAVVRHLKQWNLPRKEWDDWHRDFRINSRGFPVDEAAVSGAIRLRDYFQYALHEAMIEITGLENPNSAKQLLPWLNARGYPYDDLKRAHIERAATKLEETDPDSEIAQVLRMRVQASRVSVKKYDKLKSLAYRGRIRDSIVPSGAARTRRAAGRGVQPQNMPRAEGYLSGLTWGKTPGGWPLITGGAQIELIDDLREANPVKFAEKYPDPMTALAAAVRPCVCAPEGRIFLDADYSAIENVILGWLAGDEQITEVFRLGKDPYLAFGEHFYGIPYDELYAEYKAGDKAKRTLCKPATLGCGYMLGAGVWREDYKSGEMVGTGLLGYAQAQGITLTQEHAKRSVDVWRSVYVDTKNYWHELMGAAFQACRNHDQVFRPVRKDQHRRPVDVKRPEVKFLHDGKFLIVTLPSGRQLTYCDADLRDWLMPWKEKVIDQPKYERARQKAEERGYPLTQEEIPVKEAPVFRESLTYMNFEDYKWKRVGTHAGKLVENITQAVACDLLIDALRRCEEADLEVVLHIHDQIIVETDEDRADEDMAKLMKIMGANPGWATDAPVRASGHVAKHLIKD